MVTEISERRRYARVDVTRAIYLEVVSRGARQKRQSPVMRCETVDVSVKGLKLLVPSEVPIGSLLNIAVPEEGWIENLELEGEARWIQKADANKGYWLGLELRDTDRENMERWFKIVSMLRPRDEASASAV